MRHLLRLVALRHLRAAPGRALLVSLGCAIAVAGMVAIIGASRAVLDAYTSSIQQLAGRVDLEVGGGDAPLPEALVERLAALPAVAHLSPVIEAKARDVDHGESLWVLGVDLTGDAYFRDLRADAVDFDPLAFVNCRQCVLLGAAYARRQGIEAGARLRLATPAGVLPFVVSGLLDDREGPAAAYAGALAVLYLDAAQPLFGRAGRVDRIDVAVAPGVEVAAATAALRAAVGEGIAVEAPGRRGGRNAAMMARFRDGLQIVSLLALLVSTFMIYNTIGTAVAQRRREVGMLRALGVSRAEVRLLFVGEALAQAALGCAVGVGLGHMLAKLVLGRVQATVSSLYVDVHPGVAGATPAVAAVAVALCLTATALAALLAAQGAVVAQPAQAMQPGAVAVVPVLPWRLGLGGALLLALGGSAAAAVPPPYTRPLFGELAMMLWVAAVACLSPAAVLATSRLMRAPLQRLGGVAGMLAADNLRRDGSRVMVTVAALMVGLALALGCATFLHGFERSVGDWLVQAVPADLFVTGSAGLGQGSVRLPANLGPSLAALPHAVGLERVAVRKMTLGERRVAVTSMDLAVRLTHAHLMVLRGAAPPDGPWASRRQLLVSDNLATQLHLAPGDTLRLPTPSGLQAYEVAAVYVDYTSDVGTVMLDRAWYGRDFLDDSVDAFEIYVDAPENLAALRQAVASRFGAQHDLVMLSQAQLRGRAEDLVRGTFAVTQAMSVLAVIIALLGVMNTLVSSVLDRTHELGVLRALGAGSATVVAMFVYEALLMAQAAVLLGLLGGHIVGILFVAVVNVHDTGWHIGLYPPWGYHAQVLALAVAAAAAAAVVPALRSCRQPLTGSLAAE